MLKLSCYSIISSPLPKGGYAILNGKTGAIDLISDELAQILNGVWKNRSIDDASIPTELIPKSTLEDFIERGHFISLNHEEEKSQVKYLSGILHEVERSNPRFVIVPNLDCNYRCIYCFERPLQNSLKDGNNIVMNDNQIEKIYECIERLQEDAEASGGEIILYGGEPLDIKNKDVIYKIVNHEKAKKFVFSAVTNGHHLDAFMPLLNEKQINQIQVTIDGPKRIHDTRRISLDGQSSFERIVSNINKLLLKNGVSVVIRVHMDPANVEYLDELLDIFKKESYLDNKIITIYINVVYKKDEKGRISPAYDIDSIASRIQDKVKPYKNIYIGAPQLNSDTLLSGSLNVGKPYRLKSVYCAANSGMYVFSPDGNIYACWESIGKECSKIGNFMSENGSVFDNEKLNKWFTRSVVRVSGCIECSYCLVCGGGCSQFAEYNSGDVLNPFCDDFQKTYPDVLARSVEGFLEAQGL